MKEQCIMPAFPGYSPPVVDNRARFFFIRLFMKFGMKNPYEEPKDVFSPEFLRKKAQEVRGVRGKIEHYLKQIRLLVGELSDLWQNGVQDSFISEMGSLRNSLRDYSELVEEYAALLDYAAAELESDPAAAKKYAVLSERSEDPIPVAFKSTPDLKRTREDEPADIPFGIHSQRQVESGKSLKDIAAGLLSRIGLMKGDKDTRTQRTIRSLKLYALEMRSALTQYSFNVGKMKHFAEEMTRLWENASQLTLVEELGDMESPVKDFANIIDEYAMLLDLAAQELSSQELAADKASVLDGEDGPVAVVLSDISYLRRSRIDLKAFDPYYERTQTGVSTEIISSRKNAEYLYNVYREHIELVKYIGMKRTVELPREIDGLPVTHIGLDCFAMAWRVRFISITIPDSVTTVYHGAFRGCQYIRELRLPKSLKYIGNYAFAFIRDLEHVEIPDGVVSLGMGAFRNCDGLKEIVIPDSVLRIGNDCFYTCKSLETAVIGDGVVNIDGWAFRGCEHLSRVIIGKGVENIGESAFYDDVLLMRLDIPENVKSIGEHAFYHRRGMMLGVRLGSAADRYARDFKHKYEFI